MLYRAIADAQHVSVAVFNVLSQQISKIDEQNVAALGLSLPDVPGVYFLKIEADGESQTVKVVRR